MLILTLNISSSAAKNKDISYLQNYSESELKENVISSLLPLFAVHKFLNSGLSIVLKVK